MLRLLRPSYFLEGEFADTTGMPQGFTHRKRHRTSSSTTGDAPDEFQPTEELLPEALRKPIASFGGVFDMNMEGERKELALALWQSDYAEACIAIREANPLLVAVLEHSISNTVTPTAASIASKKLLIDGMLVNLVRGQSQLKVPLLSAAMSILAECNKISREYHDAIATFFKGAAASETWTKNFLKEARELRPPADEEMLVGVVVGVFDNLTMQIDYKSYSSQGLTGERKDMTNWFTVKLPAHLAAPGFNAARIGARTAV